MQQELKKMSDEELTLLSKQLSVRQDDLRKEVESRIQWFIEIVYTESGVPVVINNSIFSHNPITSSDSINEVLEKRYRFIKPTCSSRNYSKVMYYELIKQYGLTLVASVDVKTNQFNF